MFRLLIFLCLLISTSATGQIRDFISVKKKNGVTVKNFYVGNQIIFSTHSGQRIIDGPIDKMTNDSVFIRFYNVVTYPTVIGTRIYDTLSTHVLPYYYKDIKTIYSNLGGNKGRLMPITLTFAQRAGLGYIVLNLINSAVSGESVTESRNLRNLGIAAGVTAAAYYLKGRREGRPEKVFSRRYRVVYVKMQE
ncbi:MAG: hypothetical protein QM727_12905 [Niabella sp.]